MINKKILGITLGVVLLMTVSVVAYQMLIVRSHIGITESQTLQYQDEVGVWHDFPLNTGTTIDLGNAEIGAGDSSTFYVRGINPNNRPVMYTLVIDSAYLDLSYAVECQGNTQYAIVSGGTLGEGLTVVIKNTAVATSALGVTTIVDAGADLTEGFPLTPTTSVSRAEVDDSITWITCA